LNKYCDKPIHEFYNTIRYHTIRYIYVRSKAEDITNVVYSARHRNKNWRKTKNKNRLAQKKRCGKSLWKC